MKIVNHKLIWTSLLLLASCGGGGGGSTQGGNSNITPANAAFRVANQQAENTVVSNWVVGDVNNDGLDDVVIGGWTGVNGKKTRLLIFIQNLDGTLTDRTLDLVSDNLYDGSNRTFIADFDRDGFNDIWLPGYNDCAGCAANSVMLWGGSTGFTRDEFRDGLDSHGACLADFNGDGYLDMAVRGYYTGRGEASGYYLNNGNRSFSFTVDPNVRGGGEACAVTGRDSSGAFAMVQAGVNQLAGFSAHISVLDDKLTTVNRIGITSSSTKATDLIGALAIDMNQDGYDDFVLVFNDYLPAVPGVKDVWLNDGRNGFSYSYSLDNTTNNQYSIHAFRLGGVRYLMFDAPIGDARLYRDSSGSWSVYGTDQFIDLARQFGGRPGNDWSMGDATVYTNQKAGKIYMLQNVNGVYYTGLLR